MNNDSKIPGNFEDFSCTFIRKNYYGFTEALFFLQIDFYLF